MREEEVTSQENKKGDEMTHRQFVPSSSLNITSPREQR